LLREKERWKNELREIEGRRRLCGCE